MKAVLTHTPERQCQFLTTNQVFDRNNCFIGGLVTLFVGTEFKARINPRNYGYQLIITWGQPRLPAGVRINLTDEQFKRWMTLGSAVELGYSPPDQPKR